MNYFNHFILIRFRRLARQLPRPGVLREDLVADGSDAHARLLSLPWRLCRQRQAIHLNHRPITGLQDQIP